jgi:predicted RNA methylase
MYTLLSFSRAFAFLFVVMSVYNAYTMKIDKRHLGAAVTHAYENGNTEKLKSLRCEIREVKDKESLKAYRIYEMKDGKKVVC